MVSRALARLQQEGIIQMDGRRITIPRVLKLFIDMGSDSLDLHTLFEAGGNEPESRKLVLDVVTHLVDTGYLESRSSDFYWLTDKLCLRLRRIE